MSQDASGRVLITNVTTGQIVTADGFEEIDIDFGPGNDTVTLSNLSNTDLLNDTLTIRTGAGNDTVAVAEDTNRDLELIGGAGNDNLSGSNGADLIDGGTGTDTLDGGEGSDIYVWNSPDGRDAFADSGTAGTDTIISQSDTFAGFQNAFDAEAAGIDALRVDDATAAANADGDATLTVVGDDDDQNWDLEALAFLDDQTVVDLQGGNDTVTASAASTGSVTYLGGTGQDTLNLTLSVQALSEIVAAGELNALEAFLAQPTDAQLALASQKIEASGFETVNLTITDSNGAPLPGVDLTNGLTNVIAGNNDNDFLLGTNGDDLILGGAGNDLLFGNNGNDILAGGADSDTIDGGRGDDLVEGGDGDDLLSGGLGDDTVLGGDGDDRVIDSFGDDVIDGGDGNDILAAGFGNDTVLGGDGDDRLFGGSGNDFLVGGDGLDLLSGDSGDDTLVGSDPGDFLSGGSGDDLLISQIIDEAANVPLDANDPVAQAVSDAFDSLRDGGIGEDTLRLQGEADGNVTLSGAQFSDVRNIEMLDLTGVDNVELSLSIDDVVSMTDTDNVLTILLGEDVASVEIDNETVEFVNGEATIQRDDVMVTLATAGPGSRRKLNGIRGIQCAATPGKVSRRVETHWKGGRPLSGRPYRRPWGR